MWAVMQFAPCPAALAWVTYRTRRPVDGRVAILVTLQHLVQSPSYLFPGGEDMILAVRGFSDVDTLQCWLPTLCCKQRLRYINASVSPKLRPLGFTALSARGKTSSFRGEETGSQRRM